MSPTNPIVVAFLDFVAAIPEVVATTWQAMTWGELLGILVYFLGMRIYAESLLEMRATMMQLPRYMVRLSQDDWGQLLLWPAFAASFVALHFVIRKENNDNVRAFYERQDAQEAAKSSLTE